MRVSRRKASTSAGFIAAMHGTLRRASTVGKLRRKDLLVPVDSYKYLPRSMKTMYEATPVTDEPAAWAPLPKPLSHCRLALMTSAGIYLKDSQQPFDEEREWEHPEWGDPTYREIPSDVRQEQIACSHLHISHDDLLEDVDVVLPIRAFKK